MITYPLASLSIEEAQQLQFKVVDLITKEFKGHEILTRGDLGVVQGLNKPETTFKAERVIAALFDAQSCILVRGAGTGAIRYALFAVCKPGETLLVHKSPIYNTTKTSIDMMGIKTVSADFNNLDNIEEVIGEHPEIKAALVQYTRQSIEDRYDMEEVITKIKQCKEIPVVTDDNYAVMKVKKNGTQCGADLGCFSTFKLQGPEGIGCIVGKKEYIDFLVNHHYSGGSQTQGFEALEVLHGLVYAPVSLAIQAKVNDELINRLGEGEVKGIKNAFLANAQSKVLLVEFEEEIAMEVLAEAEKLGAAPNPVGAESKYEMVPLFYRVSGTFKEADPSLTKRMIRINPNRSGADTIIRILNEAMERVKNVSRKSHSAK